MVRDFSFLPKEAFVPPSRFALLTLKPIGGSSYGAAKAGTANAGTYFSQAVCGMINWGFNVFFFEAFDEPWKPSAVGDSGTAADETHWGAMTVTRTTKYPLKC
jgi:glucan 1,3-beta-glucosidase